MTHPLARLRSRLSYGNVTATLALFIALGGTTYAATSLPRNSVGSVQIRAGAVHSSEIRDRTIRLRNISTSVRSSLRGPQGPAGPAGPAGTADWAAINSGGGHDIGTARGVSHVGGSNEYNVQFAHDVSKCGYAGTLAAVQNGSTLEQPPPGRITVSSAGGNGVLVKTFDANGTPSPAPFHLLVSC